MRRPDVLLYRPEIACTRCHWRPALRYSAEQVEWARTLDPDRILGSYKCQNRTCGAILYICADHLQRSTPEPPPPPGTRKAA